MMKYKTDNKTETVSRMRVVQCWDDGITADIKLIEILKRHNAKATFNLNAGLHSAKRTFGFTHKETEVWRLCADELVEVYDGFVIANHSLSHPFLDRIPLLEAQKNIIEGRDRLQNIFNQPIDGFAYPFGTYNNDVANLIKDAGHVYARTIDFSNYIFPPHNPMFLHPTCHFQDSHFWDHYEKAKNTGIFYFWGHSYEMINDPMWESFEEKINKINHDIEAMWVNILDLF